MPLLRASLLRSEPTPTIRSLDEMFALAHAMEQEAASRYDDLADEMRRQHKDDLATVFAKLADAEREHVDSVVQWSRSRRGKDPDSTLVRWQMPETFDAETTAEMKASRLMTPYRALAMAVQNEERAFAFWSYMAAYSEDPEIQKAAEAMAREELGHVATLRKERRLAYHGQRERTAPGEDRDARIDARSLEHRLAEQLADMESSADAAAAQRIGELAGETMAMAREAVDIQLPRTLERKHPVEIAEALVEAYLEAAEHAHEASRVMVLQGLAQKAISRLAWLRSLGTD
jgi:rubrerythrin